MTIWTMGLCYRATNRNWTALKTFGTRTFLNLTLALLLVPRVGFIGIAWAYLAANLVCATLLLRGFAPGLLAGVVRRTWWIVPSVISGYLCCRISSTLFIPRGNGIPIQQFLATALPFIMTYLLSSYLLAPKEYRDNLFVWLRELVSFSTPQSKQADAKRHAASAFLSSSEEGIC